MSNNMRGYRTFQREIEEPKREVVYLDGDSPPPQPQPQKKRKRTVTVIDFTQDDDDEISYFSPRRRHAQTFTCMSCAEMLPIDALPANHQDHGEREALGGTLCKRCLKANFHAERDLSDQMEQECSICYDMVATHRFPTVPHAGATAHSVCIGCWERHLHSEIERKAWDRLTCPQDGCAQVLAYNEITILARGFEQAIEPKLAAQATASCLKGDETYFACPSAACKSGAFIEDGHDHGIFSCAACGHQYCFSCKIPMHVGKTCEAYQDSIIGNAKRAEEERATEQTVKALYKACPQCGYRLELMGGCDHVICLNCSHPFNWSSVLLDPPAQRTGLRGHLPPGTGPASSSPPTIVTERLYPTRVPPVRPSAGITSARPSAGIPPPAANPHFGNLRMELRLAILEGMVRRSNTPEADRENYWRQLGLPVLSPSPPPPPPPPASWVRPGTALPTFAPADSEEDPVTRARSLYARRLWRS